MDDLRQKTLSGLFWNRAERMGLRDDRPTRATAAAPGTWIPLYPIFTGKVVTHSLVEAVAVPGVRSYVESFSQESNVVV